MELNFTSLMLWKFGLFCAAAFVWGFIRRRRELRGEQTEREEED